MNKALVWGCSGKGYDGPWMAHEASDFLVSGLSLIEVASDQKLRELSKILSRSVNCGQFVMET